MGTSTNAILCYGIDLGDEVELPWGKEPNSDIADWWRRTVNGYAPPFEIFTPEGDYLRGGAGIEELIGDYFAAEMAFDEQHPLPVALVLHCSDEYPMWIVAAPGTVHQAFRGLPETIDPQALRCSAEAEQALREFCRTHLGVTDQPRWLLASLRF